MTKKGVKLIAPDKNGLLCYQGDCKVIIDPIFKVLQIHPKNFEEFFNISVLFEKKFIRKKNLLFIFGEYNFQDFVLVFKNEEICKRVHDIIHKYKEEEKDYIEEEELRQRLLIPIFQKLPQKYSTRFKRVIIDWIEKHENEEKQDLIKLYKKQKRNQNMDIKNVKQEPNVINARKRRFSEMDNNINNGVSNEEEENNDLIMVNLNSVKCEENTDNVQPKKKKEEDSPTIIDESLFKIVSVKKETGFHRKLLIFTSDAKIQCYEYNFYSTKQFYYHSCHDNANGIKAILALNKNGYECIKYENKKHRCSPIRYDSKKYEEIRIFKKPDYVILENCSTQSKRMLIIFDSNDRNLCHEYYWSSFHKKFLCCGCRLQKKYIFAEIIHENTENEYILILNNQHFCKTRIYDPKKYFESKKYVLSPNFEIPAKNKNGKEKRTLIIFYGNDRNSCYNYYFSSSKKLFNCNGCKAKGKNVSAKICKNEDGEDYVILSNAKHVCAPKEYLAQQNEVIIRPPKMKFIESNEKIRSKIFIFASNDNKLCYTFSKCSKRKSKKYYYCLGCNNLTKTIKEVCIVVLCKEDESSNGSGEYYVKMANDQKHICKPQKYLPEKYETKILKPKDDYILFQKKDKKNDSISLAVYDPNDKKLCYLFYYYNLQKCFQCSACQSKNVIIYAKIQQDSDGNEFIIMNQKKHICNPIKVSSVIKSDTVIFEKSGLSFEEEPKKKKEIDESRIIRLPNFELQKNIKGVPERKLIIFYGDDKKQCYEYWHEYDVFRCYKCRTRAKLHHDSEKNNEKCVIMGPTEHSCEPVKYVAEETKILKSSQYMIFNKDDDKKLTKLVVFTSSTKEECYEYSFFKFDKLFRCCDCFASKKIVSAKLMKGSNNEEYIKLLKNDHICAPKKFILEEFQPKIISESGFKICSNKNGKPNSKLIIFDSENDGFCYEYFLDKNIFICNKCRNKKKRVTAKLCGKENGEKYLELSAETHICKSSKI